MQNQEIRKDVQRVNYDSLLAPYKPTFRNILVDSITLLGAVAATYLQNVGSLLRDLRNNNNNSLDDGTKF